MIRHDTAVVMLHVVALGLACGPRSARASESLTVREASSQHQPGRLKPRATQVILPAAPGEVYESSIRLRLSAIVVARWRGGDALSSTIETEIEGWHAGAARKPAAC